MLTEPSQPQQPLIDSNLLARIQALTNQLLTGGADQPKLDVKPPEPEPEFNKKLLDFDYGESDDEDAGPSNRDSSGQSAAGAG